MPFADNEHPVSDLCPYGKHEPFRISVRARAARRDLHGLDADISQDRVKRRGDLPGPVPDQEPEVRCPITQIHQQVADLLRGPRTVRVRGDPEDVYAAAADLHDERQYRRRRVTAQSTWKKSVASIVDAWVCRNVRQLASVCRSGVGGIFRALRTRRIVDALTRWPSLSSSSWIRWYPQPWFSVASRSISAAISMLTGGRSAWFG